MSEKFDSLPAALARSALERLSPSVHAPQQEEMRPLCVSADGVRRGVWVRNPRLVSVVLGAVLLSGLGAEGAASSGQVNEAGLIKVGPPPPSHHQGPLEKLQAGLLPLF